MAIRFYPLVVAVVVLTTAPLSFARADVAKDFYDACISAAELFGSDKAPCRTIWEPPPKPKPKPRVTKNFVHQLAVDDPVRVAAAAFGTVSIDAGNADVRECPAALVSPGRLLITAACAGTLRLTGGTVGLGFIAKDGGVARQVEVDLPSRRSSLSAPALGLSLVDVDGLGDRGAARLPARAPLIDESVVVLDARSGRLRNGCKVALSRDGGAAAYSLDCGLTSSTGQGAVGPSGRILILSANDLSLVGMGRDGSTGIDAAFWPVRAFVTTPEAGRLLAGDGKRVIACFNEGGGRRTIREMFDCSGVWVTPRALARCIMDPRCPVFPDTPVGRAQLDAAVKFDHLDVDHVLQIDVRLLPAMPSVAAVNGCNATSDTERAFTTCVIDDMTGKDYRDLQDCIRGSSGVAQAKCITGRVKDDLTQKVLDCVGGSPTTAGAIVACAADGGATATLGNMNACMGSAADGRAVAGCIFATSPPEQRAVADCLVDAARPDKSSCLELVSPQYKVAKEVVDCLHAGTSDDLSAAAPCIAKHLPGGDATRIAGCLGNPDEETAAACVLGDNKELQAAQRVYACVSSGRDVGSLVENCTQGLGLDPKAQQALSCAARSDGDRAALLECAAGAALPPDAARLVGCAGSSQGPTDFALCASGPMMNEEWRIAAECAVESGGQPYATAGCAVTKLTIRELTNCFKGQIGKNCFGPNNTVVVTMRNALNDLVHGPGKNNEVVKALATINEGIARISPTAAAFVEKPLGSDQALIPKARNDLLNGLGVGGTGRKIIENPFQPLKWF